ncbi:RNA 2',3'-cyclic phosphodiesterase [Pseudodesulfovibrio tunisiensis]|uniref:RNA 2',3'-cyclic phosphodiesterase n=1 Tax=Pseudodesulfovibrio tunisiensis TaxID=463192 RepID=UPI001FB4E4F9|nr:RNA 2',3'-cyclic phosphodiesterase [Pseudodesulfovibrio tunisiensis]
MIRCFVGIPMPEEYRKKLKSLSDMLGCGLKSAMAWTRPETWHLTLKFIGEIPKPDVPGVQQALSDVQFGKFLFQAGGCGCFPDRKRPRVLWKGVRKGALECRELAGQVEDALAPLGIERDSRDFSPHLTLGRVKRLREDDWEGSVFTCANSAWPAFQVTEFVLWKSDLTPQGAVHTPLQTYPLY